MKSIEEFSSGLTVEGWGRRVGEDSVLMDVEYVCKVHVHFYVVTRYQWGYSTTQGALVLPSSKPLAVKVSKSLGLQR